MDFFEDIDANVRKLAALNRKIERHEQSLKGLKAEANKLKQETLPDLFMQAGITELVRRNIKYELKSFVSGSLPKEPAAHSAALDWLMKNEGDSLIKISVFADCEKGDHETADRVIVGMTRLGLTPRKSETVHPQTLQAWARERLREGDPLDAGILGLYTGQYVDYKEVRK